MKFPTTLHALGPDLLAAFSLVGLLLPEAVAYSAIANLPPQAGVMALFAGLLCYGLIGTSRFAIVSATSSSAAVLAVASGSLAGLDSALRASIALALVMTTGLLFVLAAMARLGRLTDFIARPVLQGFSFGLAIVIVTKQWAEVVGVPMSPGPLVLALPSLFGQFAQWNWYAVALAACAFAMLNLFQRWSMPSGLLVSGCAIAASFWLDFPAYQIHLVGQIELAWPQLSLPQLGRAEWASVLEMSLALVLILYAESYSAIRSAATAHGDRISANRDLFALGIANLVSGGMHGLAVGAGFSATAANQTAGAQSRWAGLFALALMALMVLGVLPLLARVPMPVLAAIVLHAIMKNLSLSQFGPYFKWQRDRFVSVVAVLAVLLLGVLDGLLLSVAVSVILLLHQIAKSGLAELGRLADSHDFVDISQYPQALRPPGLLILRPEEALFFANAERILSQARHMVRACGPSLHSVVLSLEESPDLDASSVQALCDFEIFLHKRNQRLRFARLKGAALQVLQRSRASGQELPFDSGLSVDQVVNDLGSP